MVRRGQISIRDVIAQNKRAAAEKRARFRGDAHDTRPDWFEVEDSRRRAMLIAGVAKKAGAIAALKARENNIPQVMYKEGKLVEVLQEGTREIGARTDYFSKVKLGRVYARAK